MASIIKKLSFDELYPTLEEMCKYIDERFQNAKKGKKGQKIYDGFDNYKEFLIKIESDASKHVAELFGLTSSTIKERWKVLTMPFPVYNALENNELTLSKLKPLMLINWDFDDDKDVEITKKIVVALKKNISPAQLRDLIKEECKDLWHSSTAVMERLAAQNGINSKTLCQ